MSLKLKILLQKIYFENSLLLYLKYYLSSLFIHPSSQIVNHIYGLPLNYFQKVPCLGQVWGGWGRRDWRRVSSSQTFLNQNEISAHFTNKGYNELRNLQGRRRKHWTSCTPAWRFLSYGVTMLSLSILQ